MAAACVETLIGGCYCLEKCGSGFSSERYNHGRPGHCYNAAMVMMRDFVEIGAGLDTRLAHGVLTCNAANRAQERILHAWVEIKLLDASLVVDASAAGRPIAITGLETYYKRFDVNGLNVRRYSWNDVAQFATKTEHFGPWEEPLEPSVCWTAEMSQKLKDGVYFDD